MAAHWFLGICKRHMRGRAPLTLRTHRLMKTDPERQASGRDSHALSPCAESARAGCPAWPCRGIRRADSRAVAVVPGNAAQLPTGPQVPDAKSPSLSKELPNL